jgi:RimJ/RimL family protein N-acetyltransferase
MPLSSAHLIYRPPEPDDLDRLFALYSDPQTQLFNPSGPMTDEAQAAVMLGRWIEHWQTLWLVGDRTQGGARPHHRLRRHRAS